MLDSRYEFPDAFASIDGASVVHDFAESLEFLCRKSRLIHGSALRRARLVVASIDRSSSRSHISDLVHAETTVSLGERLIVLRPNERDLG